MGVLPAASNHAIPEPFRVLMQEPSSIADFYPEDWALDLNGKKWASTRPLRILLKYPANILIVSTF
jgi:5'-3' exonuclease